MFTGSIKTRQVVHERIHGKQNGGGYHKLYQKKVKCSYQDAVRQPAPGTLSRITVLKGRIEGNEYSLNDYCAITGYYLP